MSRLLCEPDLERALLAECVFSYDRFIAYGLS